MYPSDGVSVMLPQPRSADVQVLLIVVIFLGLFLAFMFVRFSNFKSKLMNEFGKRGVSYALADRLYSVYGAVINDMMQARIPIPMIVDFIMENVDVLDSELVGKIEKPAVPTLTYEEWYSTYLNECERLDPQKNKWQAFLKDDPLRLAFRDGQDPKVIARKWVDNFEVDFLIPPPNLNDGPDK